MMFNGGIRRRATGLRFVVMTGVIVFGTCILYPLSTIWKQSENFTKDSDKRFQMDDFPHDLSHSEFTSLRKLLSVNDTESSGSVYLPDAFSLEDLRKGAVLLYVMGMVYMFVALAIVCDEFFVPSLGVITDKLQISEDVAGATFMAAGGSAPELFISIFGVFLTRDNVGIGTIVGSAVFNILFVIGMCALFSKTVLALTWWPLFRDVTFYSIDLILLIVFFLDKYIYWWEALILLLCYAAYVTFMKFNPRVEAFVKSKLSRFSKTKVISTDNLLAEKPQRTCSLPILKSGSSKFRHGVLQLMIHTIDPLADDKIHDKARKLKAVTHQETQNHNDPNSDDREKQVGFTNGTYTNDFTKEGSVQAISNGKLELDGQRMASPERNPSQQTTMTSVESVNRDDLSTRQPEYSTLNGNSPGNPNVTAQEANSTVQFTSPDTTSQDSSVNDSREKSFKKDLEEDSEPLDLSWPSTWKQRITYIVVMPIVFPMWLTLPDVRRPEKRRWFPITFLGSIFWIGGFSYLMVWWANTTGNTIGISEEIMGLTILAAGTSVPDLITSVIVAKKGYGDMAVSSSVGSNIFDITVGLPFPWLLSGLIFSKPVSVDSKGLVCSMILLFVMLMAVITSIAAFKWKMSKLLGIAMFFLYVIFLTLSILLELEFILCLDNTGT